MVNKEKYFGVVPPLLTPLLSHDQIDEKAYEEMLWHVINGGVHGVFTMASSGEALHNARRVWEEGNKISLRVVGGKLPVYCGAIAASTAQAIENIKYLEDIGAAIAVVTPPCYAPRLMQSEILRHYEAVLNHTNIDICLYSIPTLMGGIGIEPETAYELAGHDRVIMLKDSSPDWDHQQRMINLLEDRNISMMTGGETFCTSSVMLGAQGNISGFATVFPKLFVAAYSAAAGSDLPLARNLQKDIFSIMDLMKMGASAFSVMKYALSAAGIGTDINAYHTQPLSQEQKTAVAQKVKSVMEIHG